MKKILFGLALFAAIVANAGTLYWQVDTSDSDVDGRLLFAQGTTFDYATLYSVKDGTPTLEQKIASDSDKMTTAEASFNLEGLDGSASAYSFYIELVNVNNTGVNSKSPTWTYQELYDSGYISTSPMHPATGGWNGAAVPEPTSGLMFLMGGALLALRRRRRK